MKNLIKSLFNISNKDIQDPTHRMQLAFYKAKHGTLVDKIIAKVTDSEYSHVEIVFSNGISYSASPRDKGVRFKEIDMETGKWDLYKIDRQFDEELLKIHLKKFEGQPYDVLGAIGSGFGIPLYSPHKKFCSLIMAWIFCLEDINQNPESLRRILLEKGYISES